MTYLKQKLRNVLHATQFCGLCLEVDHCMSIIDEYYEINVNGQPHSETLKNIIQFLFYGVDNILKNTQICNNCTEKLIQSYIFIQNTIETSKTMASYIQDLHEKANDIHKHLNESTIESSNVVIVLENNLINDNCEKDSIVCMNITDECKQDKVNFIVECMKSNIKHHKVEKHEDFKCNICFKTFRTEQLLTTHYKVHSKVKCKLCCEIMAEKDLLDHLKDKHKEHLYSCSKCDTAYYSSNALKTHKKISHSTEESPNELQCAMCLKNFEETELKVHNCKFNCPECTEMPCIHYKYLMFYREQLLNHAIRVKCLDCNYVCRKREILLGHVNREHLDHHPYTCDKCGQQFYSKVMLRGHIQRFHEEKYICEYCDSEFGNFTTYDQHKKNCQDVRRNFLCDTCSASFQTIEALVEHKRKRHSKDIFPCGLCSKKFLKASKRKEHMVKVHSGIQNRNKVINVECIVCQGRFHTKGELVQHLKSHGPNTKYPCRICNTEYDTLRQYRAHNRKHIGPFATCNICGKEMRAILLKKHMTTHTDPIVTCETCGKSFQNIALLKYHQKIHLDSVPCPICKKLLNPARLRRHYKAHLADASKSARKQQPNLKCEQCDYKTWNNILLECHMNRHHLKIKPYVCHICSKDFIGKHLLKKHLETHTIDKSVVCMICLKSFANPACLKMHLRLHTGERPFTCEICGDRFRSSSIMNVHKLKKHSEKRNVCPLCSNKFHTIRDLRRHVIKVHWKQKKRFDPRELKGLSEEHYHLFHDGRRVKVAEEDVDFYMPCRNEINSCK